jgi:hypothetical protein
MQKEMKAGIAAVLGAALLLAPLTVAAAKPKAPLLVLKPAIEQPDDYDKVLKRAAKEKASLVVLPLRRADGHEGAFEFADVALKSGLFGKVSVGDDLGSADYAVTGTWKSWARHAGPGTQSSSTTGLGSWMWSGCEVKLDLLREGEPLPKFEPGSVEAELYLQPPFTPLLLAQAAHEGLHQVYRQALYRLAKDILKRSGR